MHARVTDFLLYKWRYPIGYLLIAALLVMTLAIATLSTPGGLRGGEIESAVKSTALSMDVIDPSMVVNLPYHVLQRAGFAVFGVTTLTIKLPSIILGLLTIIGIFFLTRIWFRRNVAVLTTVLAATSTQFLFLLQDGTAAITFSFVAVWLLLSGTCVTRNYMFNTFWKVVAGVLLAGALYMPLGIYLVITVLITASLHPHIRYIVRHIQRSRLILAISLGALSVTPLIYACIVSPATLFTLLGLNFGDNFSLTTHALTLLNSFFGFLAPANGYILTPVYSLGVVVLMSIGIYRLWHQRHTARSYIVLILSAILAPFMLIDPSQLTSIFPLAALLMAYGIAALITGWYKLFPRNPYARIAGLIPLTIIVLGMVYSGVVRYAHAYTYNPQVLSHYTYDLRLLDATLGKLAKNTHTTVVTSKDEFAFYNVVARYDKRFTAASSKPTTASATLIVTHAAHNNQQINETLNTIVTDGRASEADRFYIYKTASK